MSRTTRNKRPRVDSYSTPDVNLLDVVPGLFRTGTLREPDFSVAKSTGDYYNDLQVPGIGIVDNTADLGLFESGALLREDSRVYIGFASPSRYSTMKFSSALSMFHDIAYKEHIPSFERFSMVKSANNPMPATHACIRFDFSRFSVSACGSVPETLAAVEASIIDTVQQAISRFRIRYAEQLPHSYPSESSSDVLSTFFEWISTAERKIKLLVAVHEMQRIVQRPIDAAIWAFVPPALKARLDLVHRVLLTPVWKQLASQNGVVRKFLIVGPHFIDSLVAPLAPADFPGLPAFEDFSSCAALHGFSSSQVRFIHSLPEATVPVENLKDILRYCNIAGRMNSNAAAKNELREIYTKESLQSVFAHVTPEFAISGQMTRNFRKHFADSYLEENLEPARRALAPLFLRHTRFRTRVLEMLDPKLLSSTYGFMGPTFSIADIVNSEPPPGTTYARLFMLGLMAKYVRPGKKPVFAPAGECACALLRKIADETTNEKYAEPFQRHEPTRLDGNEPQKAKATAQRDTTAPPPVPDQDLPALNIESITTLVFTEKEIAKLILDRYRSLTNYKQLPTDEAQFQKDFVQLLRAALLRRGLSATFVHHVQVEVWLRREEAPPGESHNIRSDVVVLVRFKNIDLLYIFELKYFNPGNTMEATHKGFPEALAALESNKLRKRTWRTGMHRFLLELASIRNLPPHWYPDVARSLLHMPVALSIDHIRADYTETYDIIHKRPRVKEAVAIASGTVDQVEEYRDTAALGVGDELVDADQLLPENIETQLGWADKRITYMGPGKTKIVPFAIVNVAGALVYVNKLKEKEVLWRISIVDAYPWTADPGEPEAVKMKNMKADAARRKK